MNSETVHVVPQNDLKTHIEVGTYCHCKPQTQNERGGTVVIHNAYEPSEVYGDDGSPSLPWNGSPMKIRLKN